MLIRKAYKFRLKPTEEQVRIMHTYSGHCRFLWNKALFLNLSRLDNPIPFIKKAPIMNYYELSGWLTKWKTSEEWSFLKECPSCCLQQKLKDLDKAFKDGFDKKQPLKRMPKFKKRGMGDSFRFPAPKDIKIENRRIKLPASKELAIGWMNFYKSQSIEGRIRNATISRKNDKWYLSIQVEIDVVDPKHKSGKILGVDLGIKKFLARSDGQYEDGIHTYKKAEKKISRLQKRIAKKKKFSKNWNKKKVKLQKIHSKICNTRRDFQHKLSTDLSKSHAMIVVERLKIKNMSKSSKGSLEKPGKNVRAKSGLNKSILDQGWFEFKRQLKYKLEWLGGEFLEVDPKYTSQKCSSCLSTNKENRQTQSNFCCVKCGHSENADINAAKNILAAGHAVLAFGENALAVSVNKEPLGIRNRVRSRNLVLA